MPTEQKLTSANVIEMLVNCINKNDVGAFYTWAERYRGGLAPGGEIYQRISRLLDARPQHMTLLDSLNTNKVKGLVSNQALAQENVFVNGAARAFLNPLLTEWVHRDLYSYHNLGVRTKLLLFGPTGNGKTTLARYLARQADLPLVQVESDQLIDSHLGTTSRHINAVFAGIKEPCVLFWDEVDSVGRRRGNGRDGSSGSMENERMVNSLLVNLEKLSPSVIFVGATNRREALDPAFLRRFDAQFEVAAPSEEEKRQFARQLLAYHELPATFEPGGYEALDSFSDVRLFITEAARAYIAQKISHQPQF